MAILACNRLKKSFGIDTILQDITFSIKKGSRVGIVGPNGAGKTTLFRLLTGDYLPDSGEIYKPRDIKIGYLPQNYEFSSDKKIWDELLEVYAPAFDIESRLRDIEHQMASFKTTDDPSYIALADEYSRLLEEFEDKGGYGYESYIKGVLTGLGFTDSQYTQPISQLSGGQKARVLLAKLLLKSPSLLLLDEPTNYLDLETMEWLEQYLSSYPGTVMLISHDRYFLDSVCTSIIEIENGRSYTYNGNYSNYLRRRKERLDIEQRSYDAQQEEIERQKAIIERYRSFNREKSIRAAKSREKMLERMELVDKPYQDQEIDISFDVKRQSGFKVLEVESLSKSFGNKLLFEDVNFTLNKGDRVAIIGPNGSGKSTLIKTIMDLVKPTSGSVKLGSGVSIGYYDQEQSSLTDQNTVIDEIWDEFPDLTQTQVRNALAAFLFTGDDVFKTIGTLSGGERGKVVLTKLALAQDNFLILDEPTNHLDLDSKEKLEEALKDYPGTMLVISHDRYFLNKIIDRILVLDDRTIVEYLGNYEYYVEKKRALLKQLEMQNESSPKTKTQINTEKKKRRKKQREDAQKKSKIQALEKSIQELEFTLNELEIEMADPKLYEDSKKAKEIQIEYARNKELLDELYSDWLLLMDEV